MNYTVYSLQSLEFSIHQDKYILELAQIVEFLGFVIDSVVMEVKINPEKAIAIVGKIDHFLKKSRLEVRELTLVTGSLTFYFSSNINEVIKAVLNFLFFLRKDFSRTKKH